VSGPSPTIFKGKARFELSHALSMVAIPFSALKRPT